MDVATNKILSYSCFSRLIKSLGQRAGYKKRLSSYCFRSGYGNAIESEFLSYIVVSATANLSQKPLLRAGAAWAIRRSSSSCEDTLSAGAIWADAAATARTLVVEGAGG
jgi:hypothetical protein